MVENFSLVDELMDINRLHDLQGRLSPMERAAVANRLADDISDKLKFMGVELDQGHRTYEAGNDGNLDRLMNDGVVKLGPLMKPEMAHQLVNFFENRPCYDGHHVYRSNGVGKLCAHAEQEFTFGSYQLADIFKAPYLIEIATNPAIISLVASYLGCTPTIFSLNAWWSFNKQSRTENVTQHLHRDWDDFKFCTLFIFLTDVDDSNGPHEYIRSTHAPEELAKVIGGHEPPPEPQNFNELLDDFDYWAKIYYRTEEPKEENPYKNIIEKCRLNISGPAGTAFIADNFGLHFGHPLREKNRLVFWARYGLYKNSTYAAQQTAPIQDPDAWKRIGDSPVQRYINRLILA